MADIKLSVDQIHEALPDVPRTAIVKMAVEGLIPAIATGKGTRAHWKLPQSQLPLVEPAYAEYRARHATKRAERAAERAQAVGQVGTLKQRVERLESRMARLYEALEMRLDEPEPED